METSQKGESRKEWVETEDGGKSSCENLWAVLAVLLVVAVCQNTPFQNQKSCKNTESRNFGHPEYIRNPRSVAHPRLGTHRTPDQPPVVATMLCSCLHESSVQGSCAAWRTTIFRNMFFLNESTVWGSRAAWGIFPQTSEASRGSYLYCLCLSGFLVVSLGSSASIPKPRYLDCLARQPIACMSGFAVVSLGT